MDNADELFSKTSWFWLQIWMFSQSTRTACPSWHQTFLKYFFSSLSKEFSGLITCWMKTYFLSALILLGFNSIECPLIYTPCCWKKRKHQLTFPIPSMCHFIIFCSTHRCPEQSWFLSLSFLESWNVLTGILCDVLYI